MMKQFKTSSVSEARYLDVITSQADRLVFGYKLRGSYPGPNVLVAGFSPVADAVYDRLFDLPALPWMRGSMALIMLNSLDATDQLGPVFHTPDEKIDEVLFLPFESGDFNNIQAEMQGFHEVLSFCIRLGMISDSNPQPCNRLAMRKPH